MSGTALPQTLGQRVQAMRKRKGMRQVDLAQRADLSWRHLIRIEQDRGGVTKPETVARLAEALGVDTTELRPDDDEEEAALPSLDVVLRGYVRQVIAEEASNTSAPTSRVSHDGAGRGRGGQL